MAIKLEMKNVLPEFEFIDDNDVPKFYDHIDCHMIFDVKMDLTRKRILLLMGIKVILRKSLHTQPLCRVIA